MVVHTSATGRTSSERDAVGVPSEHHDVLAHPLEGEGLVLEPRVAGDHLVARAEEAWGVKRTLDEVERWGVLQAYVCWDTGDAEQTTRHSS